MSLPQLLTSREVAKILSISVRAIPRLIKAGKLPEIIISDRTRRFSSKDVANLISKAGRNHKK